MHCPTQSSLRLWRNSWSDRSRFSREFVFRDRRHVEPIVDLFNLTDAQTVVSKVQAFGPKYLLPNNTVNPFLTRFGLRVNF
jgi:hypothetical protein